MKRTPNPRLHFEVSETLDAELRAIAEDQGVTLATVLRAGIALVKIYHRTKQTKRHLGIVSDPTVLDTEIIGLF
jgi:hypothetical protein